MKKYLFLFSFLFYTLTSHSGTYPEWLNFTNGDNINCLLDNGDTLWAGTTGGLVRIVQSTRATTFYNKFNSRLPYNDISALARDSAGNLWLGTADGNIARFDGSAWTLYHDAVPGLDGVKILSLAIDNKNSLYAGTNSAGLLRFNGAWRSFTTANSILRDNQIWSVAAVSSGSVWVGSNLGLALLRDTTLTVFTTSDCSIPGDNVLCVAAADTRHIWVGTYNGLALFNGISSWTVYKTATSSIPSDIIHAIIPETNGDVWVGTQSGLAHLADTTWTVFQATDSTLLASTINALSQKNDTLWIGTAQGLVSKSGGQWERIPTSSSGLSLNFVKTIAVDQTGNVWMGTNGSGLDLLSGTNWSHFDVDNSLLKSGFIDALMLASDGTIWLGDGNWSIGNLAHIAHGMMSVFDTSNSAIPGPAFIPMIFEDTDRSIWVSSLKGLARLGTSGWTVYSKTSSAMPMNEVSAMARDSDGTYWIGSAEWYHHISAGLLHFDGTNSWRLFTKDSSGLPDNFITAIVVDKEDTKWMGTLRGGLVRFTADSQWTLFDTVTSNLPGDRVNALYLDNTGILWIGTDQGLARFDRDSAWTVFTAGNSGLPSNMVNAIARDTSGTMWFATTGGVTECTECGYFSGSKTEQPRILQDKRLSLGIFKVMPRAVQFSFFLSRPSTVQIIMASLNGRSCVTLRAGRFSSGSHMISWAYAGNNGARVSPGAYVIRLVTEKTILASGKIVMLK